MGAQDRTGGARADWERRVGRRGVPREGPAGALPPPARLRAVLRDLNRLEELSASRSSARTGRWNSRSTCRCLVSRTWSWPRQSKISKRGRPSHNLVFR